MKKTPNAFFALAKDQVNNALNLYLYNDIVGDSYDFWTGELIASDTSAMAIAKQLEDAGEVAEINVYINSYGGDVKEGLGIYTQLKRSAATVTAYIDGFACSIASVIAMAADKVVMGNASLMMIHKAWTCACGNADELRKMAEDLDVIDASIREAYLAKVGYKMSEDKLVELLGAETWLTAQQCVDCGLADEIAADKVAEEVEEAIEEAKEDSKQAALRAKLFDMLQNIKIN